MHIAIDVTMVKTGQAGIRSYSLGVARALADLVDVSVFVSADNADDWGNCSIVRTSIRTQKPLQRYIWRQQNLPTLIRRVSPDWMLVPAPEPIAGGDVPQAIVIHDLGPLLFPGIYGWSRYAKYLSTMSQSTKRARAIFTPSESTRLDVIRWTGRPALNVTVAGPRLEYLKSGPPTSEPISEAYVPWVGDYALYVGALLPHKNVGTLIRALESGGDALPSRLLIAGPTYGNEVEKTLRVSNGSGKVEHLGFVSSSRLDQLYRGARVVAVPSLFEGFGLPVLEALERGAHVVASDIPVLREVGGSHVTFVSQPTSAAQWAQALAETPRRESRQEVERGRISWRPAAEAVLEAATQLLVA